MNILFTGSNFVVKDIRDLIDKIKGAEFPYGVTNNGPPHTLTPRKIDHVTYHQTAGSLIQGEQGPINTARFLTDAPKLRCLNCNKEWTLSKRLTICPFCGFKKSKEVGGGRGFPKMSYHLWVPWKPYIDDNDRWVIYQCLDFNEKSWHGGKSNPTGVGVAFQGKFYSRWLGKGFIPWPETDGNPSDAQQKLALTLFTEYLRPKLAIKSTAIKGHFDFGKAACPGDWLENVIRKQRGEESREEKVGKQKSLKWNNWMDRQKVLCVLKQDLGKFGSKKDGVDGKPGNATRAAIESFQKENGLTVTGLWDSTLEEAIEKELSNLKIQNPIDHYGK